MDLTLLYGFIIMLTNVLTTYVIIRKFNENKHERTVSYQFQIDSIINQIQEIKDNIKELRQDLKDSRK